MTYARARLWLGIGCVGTVVLLAAAALATDAPARLLPTTPSSTAVELRALAAFVAAYVLLQLPFDLLGGRVLPRRFGRRHMATPSFAGHLLRGVAVHGLLLLGALLLVHHGARRLGAPGAVGVVGATAVALLAARTAIARAVGGVRTHDGGPGDTDPLAVRAAESIDEGFTGGVLGVLRPRGVVVPGRWARDLGDAGLDLVVRRRAVAVRTGAWWRGRAAALAFVLAGASLAAVQVGAVASGTVAGTVAFSLWFTLWSFLGLLVLPAPSRAAVLHVDRALARDLPDAATRAAATDALRRLDRLADDEPERAAGIEAVFHPIPSLARRTDGDAPAPGAPAWWDAARTAVYLGTGAGGLLGRAVHCNCGRPALWVFLPSA
jgi:uncharacterized membrane protein